VKVGEEEQLLVGDHKGYLHILSTDKALPSNKPRDRSIKFSGAIYAPFGISGDKTYIYVYTRNHELHALELATLDQKWIYNTDDETLKPG